MPQLTVTELAEICGASLDGDGSRVLSGPATLRDARPDQVSFLAHPKYRSELADTAAGAVVVGLDEERTRDDLTLLRCTDPQRAFTDVVQAFADPLPAPGPGIHPSAVVDLSAEVAPSASVGAATVVGPSARVGPGAVLHPHVVVGPGAAVGEATELHPFVVLYARVQLGARCLLHSGVVVGADGFGFEPSSTGWVKVPQCGSVVVGDDVEIGSGTTIDRGRFGPTRIGSGAKIDNLVHIGHNVEVGEGSLIVAQVGIAGSTRLGRAVVIGGQTGVGGHVEIGDGARIAAGSHVYGDLAGGEDYLGQPAVPRREGLRRIANARRVQGLLERLRELEGRVRELEEGNG